MVISALLMEDRVMVGIQIHLEVFTIIQMVCHPTMWIILVNLLDRLDLMKLVVRA